MGLNLLFYIFFIKLKKKRANSGVFISNNLGKYNNLKT